MYKIVLQVRNLSISLDKVRLAHLVQIPTNVKLTQNHYYHSLWIGSNGQQKLEFQYYMVSSFPMLKIITNVLFHLISLSLWARLLCFLKLLGIQVPTSVFSKHLGSHELTKLQFYVLTLKVFLQHLTD